MNKKRIKSIEYNFDILGFLIGQGYEYEIFSTDLEILDKVRNIS